MRWGKKWAAGMLALPSWCRIVQLSSAKDKMPNRLKLVQNSAAKEQMDGQRRKRLNYEL